MHHIGRTDDEQGQQQEDAGRQEHQQPDQAVLQKAAPPLNAPRMVDTRGHGVEHPERRPHQSNHATHPHAEGRRAEGLNLPRDELELPREIAEDKVDEYVTLTLVLCEPAHQRQHQQGKGKQRQQRAIRDGRRMGQAVAVVELAHAAPGGAGQQPQMLTECHSRLRPHYNRRVSDSTSQKPSVVVTPVLSALRGQVRGQDDPPTKCERCGADMYRMHAVWRCPQCRFKTDCCGW